MDTTSQGALRSKVLQDGRNWIVGSPNWTVASESNHERAILAKVKRSGTEIADAARGNLAEGAQPVTTDEMRSYARPKSRYMTAEVRRYL